MNQLNKEEYKFFKDLLMHSEGKFRMSYFRLQMYFKFNRLPSEKEMQEALDRFDNTFLKLIKFIMSNE